MRKWLGKSIIHPAVDAIFPESDSESDDSFDFTFSNTEDTLVLHQDEISRPPEEYLGNPDSGEEKDNGNASDMDIDNGELGCPEVRTMPPVNESCEDKSGLQHLPTRRDETQLQTLKLFNFKSIAKAMQPSTIPTDQQSNVIPSKSAVVPSVQSTSHSVGNLQKPLCPPTTVASQTVPPSSSHPPAVVRTAPLPPPATNQAACPVDLTDPARLTAFVPLDPQPEPQCRHGHDVNVQFTTVDNLEQGFWNGWPNGKFAIDLDHATYMKHGMLAVQWATRNCKGNNGKKNQKGSIHATTIAGGKESYKKCLGVLRCTNPQCQVITRPKIEKKILEAQCLNEYCICGFSLEHFDCGAMSFLIEYAQVGDDITTRLYRYIHAGCHNHPRIPYTKHLTAQEAKDTRQHLGNNMHKKHLESYEGGETLDGPTPPAPQLAQKFANIETYRYETKKMTKGATAEVGWSFINQFHSWIQQHEDEVQIRINTVGREPECVISFHSKWMQDQLLPKAELVEGPLPLEGMLTDGAHKYWADPNAVLISTTTFNTVIDRWVPSMFSYANGVTTQHYHWHFTAVIEAIAEAAHEHNEKITDELFALVVDFSDAQRLGFISAFTDYFIRQEDNTRTRTELENAAQSLIKGCRYHFEKSVTHVARLSNHVPPDSRAEFEELCRQMVIAENSAVFDRVVKIMKETWPGLEAWLNWWLAPEHASMIFHSQQKMDSKLASKLPDTTNAEESVHSVIYQIAGKNKDIIQGFDGLLKVMRHFQRMHDSYIHGLPIRYGRSQRQRKLDQLERCEAETLTEIPRRRRQSYSHKPSPRKRDRSALREGRAPDTQSTLKRPRKQVKITVPNSSESEDGSPSPPDIVDKQLTQGRYKELSPGKTRPTDSFTSIIVNLAAAKEFASYPWANNSCWLDASLEIIYVTLACHGHWKDFSSFAADITYPISHLHKTLSNRRAWPLSTFPGSKAGKSVILQNIRDTFKHVLAGLPFCLSIAENSYAMYKGSQAAVKAITKLRVLGPHLPPGKSQQQDISNCLGGRLRTGSSQFSTYPQWRFHRKSRVAGDATQRRAPMIQTSIAMGSARKWSLLAGYHLYSSSDQVWMKKAINQIGISLVNYTQAQKPQVQEMEWYTNLWHACSQTKHTFGGQSAVFSYDGMENMGYSQLVKGKIGDLLAGTTGYQPDGYQTVCAVYSLKGGIVAQEKFHEDCVKIALQKLDLQLDGTRSTTLTKPGYREMTREETVNWKPHISITEYQQTHSDSRQVVKPEPAHSYSPSPGPSPTTPLRTIPSSSPPPSTPLPILCRCGVENDGHRELIKQVTVQCDKCHRWSHLACLVNRMEPTIKGEFLCHVCDPASMLDTSSSQIIESLKQGVQLRANVAKRLYAGRTVLVQMDANTLFYYPGRLLHQEKGKWTIKMWRGIKHENANKVLENISVKRLVDGLYGDREGRRSIRLGRFIRTHEERDPADIASDWQVYQYNTEVDRALYKHKAMLQKILHHTINSEFSALSVSSVPALALYLNEGNPGYAIFRNHQYMTAVTLFRRPCPAYFTGGITTDDQARILNWLHINVQSFLSAPPKDFELCIAHARTLFLAHCHRETFLGCIEAGLSELEREQSALHQAWQRLVDFSGKTVDGKMKRLKADVDREALQILEKVMFDRSQKAGVAGSEQWGLDVGPPEDLWWPYDGPEKNDPDLRVATESDLEESEFCKAEREKMEQKVREKEAEKQNHAPPRPKPRPLTKEQAAEHSKKALQEAGLTAERPDLAKEKVVKTLQTVQENAQLRRSKRVADQTKETEETENNKKSKKQRKQ
ncbi:hypothetical protein D9758_017577 [Tetrapyrgos nigripes]|uniref:Zinc finger PHD-type domain-containing protein n=1 Tax=Tetrapyrgos nigripes TaxID=182062 RepID=A0A8H5CBZ4_9AGAR|nr:hypothetical protein D9758_017577 [Tetrapyrgos nigripes]